MLVAWHAAPPAVGAAPLLLRVHRQRCSSRRGRKQYAAHLCGLVSSHCSRRRRALPLRCQAPGRDSPELQQEQLLQHGAPSSSGGGNNSPPWLVAAQSWWEGMQSRLVYQYFNWRRDSFSDLQVMLLFNLGLITSAAAIRALLLASHAPAWRDFYAAAVVSFGQDLPPTAAPPADQAFSLGLYLAGLFGFAVLLALVEQSVLQVYEARVEQGSPVLETGHLLVLAWCASGSDVGKLEAVLRQLCAAHACSGGRTVVVLCKRKKTAMEALFRSAIPEQQRGGSRFVFRQGSPLNAADLRLVAADDAAVVVLLADGAACADASDSQLLRTLVLLDEMEVGAIKAGRHRPSPGHVVADMQTSDALPLLAFAPVKRVVPLLSTRAAAVRLASMVTRPVISSLGDRLYDFTNATALYVQPFPQLTGELFADLTLRFQDGIVLGVVDVASGAAIVNPPGEYRLGAQEQLLLLRPTNLRECDVAPLPTPVEALVGDWNAAEAAAAWQASAQALRLPFVVSCACPAAEAAAVEAIATGSSSIEADDDDGGTSEAQPAAAAAAAAATTAVVVVSGGIGSSIGSGSSASASSSSGVNSSRNSSVQALLSAATSFGGAAVAAGSTAVPAATAGTAAVAANAGRAGAVAGSGTSAISSWDESFDAFSSGSLDVLSGLGPGWRCDLFSITEAQIQIDRSKPLRLLVLGWGSEPLMADLLLALGTGVSALPDGSSVTFANAHPASSLDAAMAAARVAAGPASRQQLAGLRVDHVLLNPLLRCHLGRLELSDVNAALILCDASWSAQSSLLTASASAGAGNGSAATAAAAADSASAGLHSGAVAGGSEPDAQQLGALLLRVQLNLRSLLQQDGREGAVNIISEQQGGSSGGGASVTRFEDRARLPIGVPVNLSTYAAGQLAALAVCPHMVLPQGLGGEVDPLFVEAELYARQGEKVTFWQLMARARQLRHTLLGYFLLPVSASEPIQAVLCPPNRHKPRVWNSGDARLKFIMLHDASAGSSGGGGGGSSPRQARQHAALAR